jgi:hypothetical protein
MSDKTNSSRPVRPVKASVGSTDWRRYKEQIREWKNARIIKQLDAEEAEEVEQEASISISSNSIPQQIKGRSYTLSIALPASILRNAQSSELRTYLAGQIGRAACVFNIDEIVVFDDDETSEEIDNNPFSASEQLIRLLEYLEW